MIEKLEGCPNCGDWASQSEYDSQKCRACGYGYSSHYKTSVLVEAACEALDTMQFAKVFVASRQRIKKPEGEEMYRESMEKLHAALALFTDFT